MTRIPCKLCGDEALPATIERTGGYCMPCFKDPEGRKAWVEEMRRPKPTLEEALDLLEERLAEAFIAVAKRAVGELAHEGIYGFNIHVLQFEVGGVCDVLTEAGLQQVWDRRYAANCGAFDRASNTVKSLRWSLAEAAHLAYSSSTGMMIAVEQTYRDLWPHRDVPEIHDWIMDCAIQAGIKLRESGALPDDVILTLMNDSMNSTEKVETASHLNSRAVLDRFIDEVEFCSM